jgi:hypothetical protein
MKGNKGEWSEIYTFLRLLGDGNLYGGNENLEKIESIYYPLVSVIREESDVDYSYNRQGNVIIIQEDGNKILELHSQRFTEKAEELLGLLKSSNGRSFEFPYVEYFLKQIQVNKLKSTSDSKRDITIVVHDTNTNTTPALGFSIKSRIGGNSTLLNPGETTNFIYKIKHDAVNQETFHNILMTTNNINTRSKIKDRTKYLDSSGLISFHSIQSQNLLLNLQLIDSLLPEIISQLLLYYYKGKSSSVRELVDILEEENPLNFNQSHAHKFYEYKIKSFLTDVALGMTPQKKWSGHYDATGGFIIVKDDGEIVCYHIYNRNEFQNYLLNHTILDTPSSSRYGFGKVYKADNEYFYKLNLQVRFK